jgi:dephospho-CoA kinase
MIIGITGTDGAGKGTVVEYLCSRGFTHYSSSGFIQEEVERQGLSVTRNQLRLTGNELRAKHGNDVVVKTALARALADKKEHIIIESIRALAEAVYIQEHGGVLLAIDADLQVRYERVQRRRSHKDQVTFEEFVNHETLERNDPDPHGMQKAAVAARADYTIHNNGTVAELYHAIDYFLSEYGFR